MRADPETLVTREGMTRRTHVDVQITFTYEGAHTLGDATAATEERLCALAGGLVAGIDAHLGADPPIRRHHLAPEPALWCSDTECPATPKPHEPVGWCIHAPGSSLPQAQAAIDAAAAADARSRIACALDLLAARPQDPAILDLLARALTRTDYQHWCAAHNWPGARP
jgi:hypothetical protein